MRVGHSFWLGVGIIALVLSLGILPLFPGGVFIWNFPAYISTATPTNTTTSLQIVLLVFGVVFTVAGLI